MSSSTLFSACTNRVSEWVNNGVSVGGSVRLDIALDEALPEGHGLKSKECWRRFLYTPGCSVYLASGVPMIKRLDPMSDHRNARKLRRTMTEAEVQAARLEAQLKARDPEETARRREFSASIRYNSETRELIRQAINGWFTIVLEVGDRMPVDDMMTQMRKDISTPYLTTRMAFQLLDPTTYRRTRSTFDGRQCYVVKRLA